MVVVGKHLTFLADCGLVVEIQPLNCFFSSNFCSPSNVKQVSGCVFEWISREHQAFLVCQSHRSGFGSCSDLCKTRGSMDPRLKGGVCVLRQIQREIRERGGGATSKRRRSFCFSRRRRMCFWVRGGSRWFQPGCEQVLGKSQLVGGINHKADDADGQGLARKLELVVLMAKSLK